MNLTAIAITAAFILIAGLILYVPGHFFAKWLLRRSPAESGGKRRITPAGLAVILLMVATMMFGFSMQYVAPESWLGQFVGTRNGRLIFGIGIALIFVVVEFLLGKCGVQCVTSKNND